MGSVAQCNVAGVTLHATFVCNPHVSTSESEIVRAIDLVFSPLWSMAFRKSQLNFGFSSISNLLLLANIISHITVNIKFVGFYFLLNSDVFSLSDSSSPKYSHGVINNFWLDHFLNITYMVSICV